MLAQYLPARWGIPIGIGAVILASWNLGFIDLHGWHFWFVLILAGLVIWRIALVLYWLKKRKKASRPTAALKIGITKAFYSSAKTETISGITKASHFVVIVELALHIKKLDIQMSWIQLYIAGKYLEPIRSLPSLRDDIRHSDETYELIFEVPVKAFLKGRYSIGSIRPDKTNPEAQIYIKADGQDWYSEPFSIPPERGIA